MGGQIALTLRWSSGEEWRGSCWTNVLPTGLFGADFYDADRSETHTREWHSALLGARASDQKLAEMWGGHNLLAPVGYGIVVVDYRTRAVLNQQDYCSPLRKHTGDLGLARVLWQRGLVRLPWRSRGDLCEVDLDAFVADLKRDEPKDFWSFDVRLGWCEVVEDERPDAEGRAWVEQRFVLSDAERAAWDEWFRERERS